MGMLDPYARWLINPSAPSGTGATPVDGTAGPYQSLIGPPIINMNDGSLFSIPAISLHFDTEVGGNMQGLIQFWDDDAEIHEQSIATLSAYGIPVSTTDYGLPNTTATAYGTGTVNGSWANLITPIPAGSGYLVITSGIAGAGINAGSSPADPDNWSVTGATELEFDDGTIITIMSATLAGANYVYPVISTPSNWKHETSMATKFNFGDITKCRCNIVCSAFSGGPHQYITGSVGGLSIRRLS